MRFPSISRVVSVVMEKVGIVQIQKNTTEYKRMIAVYFPILFIGHYLFPPSAMNHLFYQLPIRFGPLMARQDIPTCCVGVSIAQMLYLLIHPRYGELRSDRSFGCRIWEVEFEQSLSNSDWSGELSQSL